VPTERLVHIVDEVPELAGVTDLTLVLVLDGFLDAGNAAAHAARHLADLDSGPEGPGPVVATFEVDQFHDYRARRPAMSFVRDHYEAYDAPRLVVRLLRDSGGTPYLLLHGPEPDNRWEAFARAFREVVEQLGVTRVVAMGAVPMAVPHTRPIAITPHANRPELLLGTSPWRGELRIPSSAQSLLEVRLGEWGHDMLGFVAHIPHYLAQLDYPNVSYVDFLGHPYTQSEIERQIELWVSLATDTIADSVIDDYVPSELERVAGALVKKPLRCADYWLPGPGLTQAGASTILTLDLDDIDEGLRHTGIMTARPGPVIDGAPPGWGTGITPPQQGPP